MDAFCGYLRQSTQTDILIFVLDTDVLSPETTALGTIRLSKNAGAFATASNAASHIEGGQWKLTLTTAELNTRGRLRISINDNTKHVTVSRTYIVLDPSIYDLFFDSSNADIAFQSLTINNTTDHAVQITTSASNKDALRLTGHPTSRGLVINAGAVIYDPSQTGDRGALEFLYDGSSDGAGVAFQTNSGANTVMVYDQVATTWYDLVDQLRRIHAALMNKRIYTLATGALAIRNEEDDADFQTFLPTVDEVAGILTWTPQL